MSEKSQNWESFLYQEFIRLFEIAQISNIPNDVFSVIEEISSNSEEEKDVLSEKVIACLYGKLNDPHDPIRLKALWLISLWLYNDGSLQKSNFIIQKIYKMLKDEHWKIKWLANNTLTGFEIFPREEIKLTLKDSIRGKLDNPYEIDS